MADVPEHLKLHRTVQLNPTLKVDYYDRTDPAGRGYVVARFEEKVTDSETRVFRADLDRVEEAVSRAYAYRASGAEAERFEPFLGMVARLKRGDFPGRIDPISMHLMQKAPDGSGRWQALEASESCWSRAAREGREVEAELGYDARYHVYVYADSLRKDAHGQIQAVVGLEVPDGRGLRSGEEQLALAEPARERAGPEQGRRAISTDSDDRPPPMEERRQEFGRGL